MPPSTAAPSPAANPAAPVAEVDPVDAEVLARAAGLRTMALPDLADVDRRRTQLWGLSLLAALVLPAIALVARAGLVDTPVAEALGQRDVQLVLLAMLVVVMGYVAEREVTLRRLTRLLVEERTLTTSLVDRVDELDLLQKATRAMNSALDPDVVLGQIASSAKRLLAAAGVAIQLVDDADPDVLVVTATAGEPGRVIGQRQRIADGIVGNAVSRRDALLITAGDTAPGGEDCEGRLVVVPLERRGTLVGVLTVVAEDGSAFTAYHLRALRVFADAAAGAISNARAHHQQLGRVADLLAADRAKDEFLTLVTHELRTPLTSIIGLMSTLARRGASLDGEEVMRLAEVARGQGWRLDRLIENLLESSRSQLGAAVITPAATDVGRVVADAVLGLQRAVPEHPITVDAPADLRRMVDVDALLRILDNLLANAAKYCPEGTAVHVSVRGAPHAVVLSVADSGPGVDAEGLGTIFDKFTRGPDPYDRGGLGLGLYVVQALAEAHGGRVEASTTPGGGATFTVWLAAAPVDVPAAV